MCKELVPIGGKEHDTERCKNERQRDIYTLLPGPGFLFPVPDSRSYFDFQFPDTWLFSFNSASGTNSFPVNIICFVIATVVFIVNLD